MARTWTRLNKITINKFRALEGIEIDIANNITVICGKNGTSKSTILGIAAQMFSFEKDFHDNDRALEFSTLTGAEFKSYPGEHFRFSPVFDKPKSMDVSMEVYDGYTKETWHPTLTLTTRRIHPFVRPVVRKNLSIPNRNTSRNFVHPVIYLSLRRLMPIPFRNEYTVRDLEYLAKHQSEFLRLNNTLLNKRATTVTATEGDIMSAAGHGMNYDQDSVSAGEDNAGQIVLALMSFKKLKDEYPSYKGGLLLIDEADAGLFPAAQSQLIELLDKQCNELNIQAIITSHSPVIIEKVYNLSKRYQQKFKTIYLTDTYGKIESIPDQSWPDIYADLMIETIQIDENTYIPKVNFYAEDPEAFDFFDKLITSRGAKSQLTILREVSLGCSNYIQLVKKNVPEFSKKSLILLDGDVEDVDEFATILKLPGDLPPDQLLFELLYNKPPTDPFWKNPQKFSRPVFDRITTDIVARLDITDAKIDLKSVIIQHRKANNKKEDGDKLRSLFKNFYKTKEIQNALKNRTNAYNPWKIWIAENHEEIIEFRKIFALKLLKILESAYGVDETKLPILSKLAARN